MIQKNLIQNILVLCIIGCIVLSASSSTPVNNDPFTGLYFVHGSKIVTYYRCPFIDACGPDAGPFHDTTRIASIVAVKLVHEKADTLHFFGLPGADEGESKIYHGTTQLTDHTGGMLHYDEIERYRIYGSFFENSFKIHHNNAGNRFIANGSITNQTFKIQGQKKYRTITVEYDLEGEKIDISI